MNKLKVLFAVVLLLTGYWLAGEVQENNDGKTAYWREEFANVAPDGNLPCEWGIRGTMFNVPKTRFNISPAKDGGDGQVLVVEARKATGALATNLTGKVNLGKTPIMRWRWRVLKLPEGADGRNSSKDDQALSVYIGADDWGRKKCIVYRWETETPKGKDGDASYAAGLVVVKWFCLRNKEDGLGKWYIEERNVAEDFKKAYGFVPEKFALSVGANSQYSKSDTIGEIAFIEFVPSGKTINKLAKK